MKNDYEIRGDTTCIFLKRTDGVILETLISSSDLLKAKSFSNTWMAWFDNDIQQYYVVGNINISGKRTKVRLHRWLLDAPKELVVDHINHDTLDNTRGNLRVVTNAQNQQNRKGAMKNNFSSGIRGITWHKRDGKWQASIRVNYKFIFLGYFKHLKDAKNAVVVARRKYMPFSKDYMMRGDSLEY